MNWEQPYVVSKSLTFHITSTGVLAASNSVSRIPDEIAIDAIPVLGAFAQPASPKTALAELQKNWELDADGFAVVVEMLVERNFLTPADGAATEASLATSGFASVLNHHFMLRDNYRVMSYKAAISKHVAGKSVVEVGCGTGILSIFAAQAGATKVTAIEESAIAAVAKEMFTANGCDSIVDLRLGNSRDISVDEPADVLIHEILGIDPFAENLLFYIDDARRRLLKPGGRLLPDRLEVFCIGVEVEDKPYASRDRTLLETAEFSGMYGVNFDPVAKKIAALESRAFRRPISVFEGGFLKSKILTQECRLLDINLYEDWSESTSQPSIVNLQITDSGSLGAVIIYFKAHLDETTIISNGPFVPVTSWARDIRELSRLLPVERGTQVPLRVEIENVLGKEKLAVDLV
ncbi:MAG TPA: 50S ribosomal protein L11 methyltransferase [Thermoanaerobaculia bacterium]|nr:50S ribosomal protein L11 methyltransferase [Thermoanaerobaculia bacterium]